MCSHSSNIELPPDETWVFRKLICNTFEDYIVYILTQIKLEAF